MTAKATMNVKVNKSCTLDLSGVGMFSISTESAYTFFLFCLSNIKKNVSQRLILKLETPSAIRFKDSALVPYEVDCLHIDYFPEKPDVVEMAMPGALKLEFDINSLKAELINYLIEVDPWGFGFLTNMSFDFKLPVEDKEIDVDQTWCKYPIYLDVDDYIGFFIKDGERKINLHPKCLFTSNKSIPRPNTITEICISYDHYSKNRYDDKRLSEIMNAFYNRAFDQI